jgi:hypothetical protein
MQHRQRRTLVSVVCLPIALLAMQGGCDGPQVEEIESALGTCQELVEQDASPCRSYNCDSKAFETLPDGTGCKVGARTGQCAQGTCEVPCAQDSECADGAYCSSGQCMSCSDGVQNGDENGLDCGGSHCSARCNGEACAGASECKSGQCSDAVCCDTACDGACSACNVPGSEGTCSDVPAFEGDTVAGNEDLVCSLENGFACNGTGQCLKLAGAHCIKNAECMNNTCTDEVCKGAPGEPCNRNGDCVSAVCSFGLCK